MCACVCESVHVFVPEEEKQLPCAFFLVFIERGRRFLGFPLCGKTSSILRATDLLANVTVWIMDRQQAAQEMTLMENSVELGRLEAPKGPKSSHNCIKFVAAAMGLLLVASVGVILYLQFLPPCKKVRKKLPTDTESSKQTLSVISPCCFCIFIYL